MLEQEAMQLLTNVCAGVQGTLKDHQLIQEALGIIKGKAFPKPTPVPVPDKKVGSKEVKKEAKAE